MGAATMADVARVAGVSKKSVSNYFNGYPYMTPDTRARIESAIQELNYKVNVSARNLSSGRTGTIALVIPELAHPYFAELAQAVDAESRRRRDEAKCGTRHSQGGVRWIAKLGVVFTLPYGSSA